MERSSPERADDERWQKQELRRCREHTGVDGVDFFLVVKFHWTMAFIEEVAKLGDTGRKVVGVELLTVAGD